MSKKQYRVDLDLNREELLNSVIQRLSTAPLNPKEGQVYYDTSTSNFKGFTGQKWEVLNNKEVEDLIADIINDNITSTETTWSSDKIVDWIKEFSLSDYANRLQIKTPNF